MGALTILAIRRAIEDAGITPDDIGYAKDLGLSLKLVGSAQRIDGGVAVHVYPAFLYAEHPLASVHGPFNAVTLESEAITEVTLSSVLLPLLSPLYRRVVEETLAALDDLEAAIALSLVLLAISLAVLVALRDRWFPAA